MTSDDASDPVQPTDTPETPAEAEADQKPVADDTADEAAGSAADEAGGQPDAEPENARRRILIGSQRDPAAYLARRTRDWVPVAEPEDGKPAEEKRPKRAHRRRPEPTVTPDAPQATAPAVEAVSEPPSKPPPEPPSKPLPEETAPAAEAAPPVQPPPDSGGRFPLPNLRDQLPSDLEDEFNRALGDESLDELLGDGSAAEQAVLEEESRHTGRVVAVHGDDVFVELGSREQGCVSAKQFEQPPEVGAELEVIVQRFNAEEGLYDLALPNRAMDVDDWADIEEGMLLDARVTGHNAGGLECEVNRLRGFIPVSQIALYRVEDLAQFVDEKFTCLVTEANPERRNLVLSRRAVLEREKAEAREKFLASLEPGQVHEGVVRKLLDFGAFVDIGGLDGLLHISQLSWGRVSHPSEVLEEGQTIKVKIEKIDRESGKMSLAYRDMLENPWDGADRKYPANSLFEGTVTKLMEFGAFVELERGLEGLVHISELAHKRVWRPSDVVHEGDKVQVMVLSVDTEAQRMSLSIRQAIEPPEPAKKEDESEPEPPPEKPSKRKRPDRPLKGGLGRSSGGEGFGLRW